MTDKEKQVEEMAKDLCPLYKEYKTCNTCDAVIDIGDEPCVYKVMAEMILAKGYRKASDIINEFAYGLKDFLHDAPVVYQAWFRAKIDNFADRFKKKYESEDKRD